MDVKAFKMDGLGNDFVIIDRRKEDISLSKEQIIKIGDRNNVGFDQIIFIEKEINDVFPIKIFNPDGIEVGACGNGSRCIAYLILKENNQRFIKLKAEKKILEAEILSEKNVKINMGFPKFNEWYDIPLENEKLNPKMLELDFLKNEFGKGFCVNVGNPHIIFFVEDCSKIDITNLGPKIELHHYFPERVNVTFAQIIDNKNIKVNVWERGAGQTKACGTAACATVVAGYLRGLTSNNCNIHFREGKLDIDYDRGNGQIYMTGPVSDIKEITLKI
jgi:diaminopimelate epimerase